jgi:hypothetical protein
MIIIWQHHARTEIQKRLASVHSIIGRGSLIPLSSLNISGMCHFKASRLGFLYGYP